MSRMSFLSLFVVEHAFSLIVGSKEKVKALVRSLLNCSILAYVVKIPSSILSIPNKSSVDSTNIEPNETKVSVLT